MYSIVILLLYNCIHRYSNASFYRVCVKCLDKIQERVLQNLSTGKGSYKRVPGSG